MLYAFSQALKTRLEGKRCPVPVQYGPIRENPNALTTRIVVERMRGTDESIEGPKSKPANPPQILTTVMHGRIRIFASSTADGSGLHTHERLADLIKRIVLVQTWKQFQADKTLCNLLSCRIPTAEELEMDGLLTWPGVVIDIHFTVVEGCFDVTWTEAAADQAILGTDFTVPTPTPTTSLGS